MNVRRYKKYPLYSVGERALFDAVSAFYIGIRYGYREN